MVSPSISRIEHLDFRSVTAGMIPSDDRADGRKVALAIARLHVVFVFAPAAERRGLAAQPAGTPSSEARDMIAEHPRSDWRTDWRKR
jgi:hypothetical protein